MSIIKLTDTSNNKILVNLQNVTHIILSEDGSVIYTVKESDYHG